MLKSCLYFKVLSDICILLCYSSCIRISLQQAKCDLGKIRISLNRRIYTVLLPFDDLWVSLQYWETMEDFVPPLKKLLFVMSRQAFESGTAADAFMLYIF